MVTVGIVVALLYWLT